MKQCHILWGVLSLCFLLGLSGCGGGGPKRLAITGTVKFQGKPLNQGSITFLSDDPAGAAGGGALITDGQYSIPAQHGLLPGRYKVSIGSADPKKVADPDALPGAPGPVYQDRIPAKYNTKTTLFAEVQADGKNKFDFELQ
jgi:hypothetical protein